jgi:centromere protein I
MPIVSVFLQDYIKIWDGISDIDATLGLLSYLPVQPFEGQ